MLLLERYGIEQVDRIRLAGAFGSHIDPVYALVLGLVPDCDPARVTSAGNAAGTGARIALLDRSARAEIEEVVRRVEKIETAVEPRFQELFVGAMAIPHDTDPVRATAHRRHPSAPARGGGGRGPFAPPPFPELSSRCSPKEPFMTETVGSRRSGGRAARQAARAVSNAVSVPYITRTLKPFEVLTEEHLAVIEENADIVLEQVGIDFRDTPDALGLFKDAGPISTASACASHAASPAGSCRPPHPPGSRRWPGTRRTTSRSAA